MARSKSKRESRKGSTRTQNSEIARLLRRKADLLEIQGANPFRVRAYQNAARSVESHSRQIHQLVEEGQDLTDLQGVGDDLAGQIERLVKEGSLPELSTLEKKLPGELTEVMRIPTLGPKKTEKLWKELGIESIDDLEEAAKEGRVADVEGFGEKTQEKILRGIGTLRKDQGRFKISEADQYVESLLEYLNKHEDIQRMEVAGSYRRRKETVGDLDILVTAKSPKDVMDHFTEYSDVERTEQAGTTRGTVVLRTGLQVDLRVLDDESYGAALVYFTGSKEHNVRLRKRAQEKGLRVSEYGVFREKGKRTGRKSDRGSSQKKGSRSGELIAGSSEPEVYNALDLRWIPPELREDRGEIEAAASRKDKLPDLIEIDDLRGDLQMHSKWSDGKAELEDMLAACADLGYDYFAITDHSQSLAMTGGLDEKRLKKQIREIEKLQEQHEEIRILKGLEIDIHKDGSLDLSDEMIEKLDYVLVSIHSHFDLSGAKQTRRIVKALEHPLVNALAHPTGRRIKERDPMTFDMGEVLDCAKENHVAVELNAQPDRLDLSDEHLLEAKRRGAMVVLGTDAHRPEELRLMRHGIDQARRGWLSPKEVLNTRTIRQLEKFLLAGRRKS